MLVGEADFRDLELMLGWKCTSNDANIYHGNIFFDVCMQHCVVTVVKFDFLFFL